MVQESPNKRQNIIDKSTEIFARLKGEILRNLPSNPLKSWRYLFNNTMIESIVKYSNQRIETMSEKYNQLKRRKNSRRQYFPTFIKPTDKIKVEAFIGPLLSTRCFQIRPRGPTISLGNRWNRKGFIL
ncbi:hypothetical protein NQ314_015798 [Rhamnusium bicolor]|uniref:Translocon at the inner envelope membrane of chloroplasts 214 n=1 Tax=Rhamnusium bicolor TaxID=1586634 RepID=A0AAV8WYE5_9CUCU|nr:hypothetical protein NQ314_015798 [Rhamnusium bicolor]